MDRSRTESALLSAKLVQIIESYRYSPSSSIYSRFDQDNGEPSAEIPEIPEMPKLALPPSSDAHALLPPPKLSVTPILDSPPSSCPTSVMTDSPGNSPASSHTSVSSDAFPASKNLLASEIRRRRSPEDQEPRPRDLTLLISNGATSTEPTAVEPAKKDVKKEPKRNLHARSRSVSAPREAVPKPVEETPPPPPPPKKIGDHVGRRRAATLASEPQSKTAAPERNRQAKEARAVKVSREGRETGLSEPLAGLPPRLDSLNGPLPPLLPPSRLDLKAFGEAAQGRRRPPMSRGSSSSSVDKELPPGPPGHTQIVPLILEERVADFKTGLGISGLRQHPPSGSALPDRSFSNSNNNNNAAASAPKRAPISAPRKELVPRLPTAETAIPPPAPTPPQQLVASLKERERGLERQRERQRQREQERERERERELERERERERKYSSQRSTTRPQIPESAQSEPVSTSLSIINVAKRAPSLTSASLNAPFSQPDFTTTAAGPARSRSKSSVSTERSNNTSITTATSSSNSSNAANAQTRPRFGRSTTPGSQRSLGSSDSSTIAKLLLSMPEDRVPLAAPKLKQTHFECYKRHRQLMPSRNVLAPVVCMTCGDDAPMMHKCSWCCLRVCAGCKRLLGEMRGDLQRMIRGAEVLGGSDSVDLSFLDPDGKLNAAVLARKDRENLEQQKQQQSNQKDGTSNNGGLLKFAHRNRPNRAESSPVLPTFATTGTINTTTTTAANINPYNAPHGSGMPPIMERASSAIGFRGETQRISPPVPARPSLQTAATSTGAYGSAMTPISATAALVRAPGPNARGLPKITSTVSGSGHGLTGIVPGIQNGFAGSKSGLGFGVAGAKGRLRERVAS